MKRNFNEIDLVIIKAFLIRARNKCLVLSKDDRYFILNCAKCIYKDYHNMYKENVESYEYYTVQKQYIEVHESIENIATRKLLDTYTELICDFFTSLCNDDTIA